MECALLFRMKSQSLVTLLTLDATGTLFDSKRGVGAVYREALLDHVPELSHPPSEATLAAAFKKAYSHHAAERPCFGALHRCDSAHWWFDVVRDTFATAVEPFSAVEDALPALFASLYDAFATEDAWVLKRHAVSTLRALRAQGITLAVVSNWDERLRPLLASLGIADYFAAVITSREVGYEKPSPGIFQAALAATGTSSDAYCVHVGDTYGTDVAGARAACFVPVLVIGEGGDKFEDCTTIEDLGELLELVAPATTDKVILLE